MKNLVVQQDLVGGWNVHEVGVDLVILYRSDRLRAEGFARRVLSPEGGTVTVISHAGEVLHEYAAKGAGRSLMVQTKGRSRRVGRRRQSVSTGYFLAHQLA